MAKKQMMKMAMPKKEGKEPKKKSIAVALAVAKEAKKKMAKKK